jgi:uncharacterized protein (TIGR03437 family)
MIRTVAGTGVGGFSGDGGPATAADLFIPLAVAVDAAGDLFIADYGNHRVRRVDAETGIITTFAGSDPFGGFTDVLADGSKATSVPLLAQGLALDANGNLLVATHDAIVKITTDGIFHVVAGTRDGFGRPLDGARALSTAVPADTLAIDSSGTIYFSGSNNVDSGIWSIGTDGIIHPVVPYTVATSLANTSRGILASTTSSQSVFRLISGGLELFAGAGVMGFSGDGGPGVSALLNSPKDLTLDAAGNVFILDRLSFRVRKLAPGGEITTVAGSGVAAENGDGGPATAASFYPTAIAADAAGNLYIGDAAARVRKVDVSGMITTYAGNGSVGGGPAFVSDGHPAVATAINPSSLAADSVGNLYIADLFNRTVLKVTADGIAHVLLTSLIKLVVIDPNDNVYAISGQSIYKIKSGGELEEWKAASRFVPSSTAIAVDAQGSLYAAQTTNQLTLIRYSPEGALSTYLVSPRPGMSTADGPALSSLNYSLTGLAIDAAGNIYFSDSSFDRVRMIPSGCQPAIIPFIFPIRGVTNAASSAIPAAPGSLFAITGANLHFGDPATVSWTSGAPLPTILNGTRVLIDGTPAGLVSVAPDRIVVAAPYKFPSTSPEVIVEANGFTSNIGYLGPVDSAPALFSVDGTGSGQAVIQNADGTANTAANPAKKGSMISLFVTGAGALATEIDSGVPAPSAMAVKAKLTVTLAGQEQETLSAGTVPGLVTNVIVIAIRVPLNAPSGPAILILVNSVYSGAQNPTVAIE